MSSFTATGFEAAERKLDELARSTAGRLPAALRDVAETAARNNAAWWGSAPWPPLSRDYAARKAKRYPGRPVEVRTGRLRDSLTRPELLIRSISAYELKLGTNVPYARAQSRRLLPKTSPEQAWRDRIARHLAAGR